MKEFAQWTTEVITICKASMTEESLELLEQMDDKKLGGLMIQGFINKHTPPEMAICITDAIQ